MNNWKLFFSIYKKNSEQRWNNSSYRARTSVWAIHRNSCFKKRHDILIYEILKLPSPHPLLTSCLTEKYLSIITYSSQSCTNIYFRETGASLLIISVHCFCQSCCVLVYLCQFFKKIFKSILSHPQNELQHYDVTPYNAFSSSAILPYFQRISWLESCNLHPAKLSFTFSYITYVYILITETLIVHLLYKMPHITKVIFILLYRSLGFLVIIKFRR